jgi:uncharacterized metal-binding protein YceD (DUF177 family)
MIIRVSEIPPEGRIINETISLTTLNDRMAEGQGNDIVFLEPPTVSLNITHTRDGLQAAGKAESVYQQPCAYCLETIKQKIAVDFDFILKPAGTRSARSVEEDDPNLLYYEGQEIDLEEVIQESLILALSPFLRPERDPEGRCLECGMNLKERFGEKLKHGTRLGDLLAAVSKGKA